MPEERELALLVVAPQPELVERHIADLTFIGEFRLIKCPTVVLRDTYWDLPGRPLGLRKVALRLRTYDGRTWIALKGPSEVVGKAGVRRMELEEAWSAPALREVLERLEQEGVLVGRPALEEGHSEPMEVMRALGLEVIQDRETRRELRNVMPVAEQDDRLIAELAIDVTRYHIDGRVVTLREIEIEARTADGASAIEAIGGALVQLCSGGLRPWEHSKLATGLAIEALFARGEADRLWREDDGLAPTAYDMIDSYLAGS